MMQPLEYLLQFGLRKVLRSTTPVTEVYATVLLHSLRCMQQQPHSHALYLLGPGRLCQHNSKYNRLSILVRTMLEQ